MILISKITAVIISIFGIGLLIYILGFSHISGAMIGIITVADFLMLYHLFWAFADNLLKIRFRYMKIFVIR